MDRLGGDTAPVELLGDTVGTMLGPREYDHPRQCRIIQHMASKARLSPELT